MAKLGDRLEWRAANYFYDPGDLRVINHPGNSHVMAVWRRELFGGKYPEKLSGSEDQAFNRRLAEAGFNQAGEVIPISDIYYIHRRATGSYHLSGKRNGPDHDPHKGEYDYIGTRPVAHGTFTLRPRWQADYVATAQQRERMLRHATVMSPTDLPHQFNFGPRESQQDPCLQAAPVAFKSCGFNTPSVSYRSPTRRPCSVGGSRLTFSRPPQQPDRHRLGN